jgi:hypothetical protein
MEAHCSLAGSNAYGNVTIAFIPIKAPVVFLKQETLYPRQKTLRTGHILSILHRSLKLETGYSSISLAEVQFEIEESDVLRFMLHAHAPDSGQLGGWSMGLISKKTHSGLYFRVGTIDLLAPFQDAEMKVTII